MSSKESDIRLRDFSEVLSMDISEIQKYLDELSANSSMNLKSKLVLIKCKDLLNDLNNLREKNSIDESLSSLNNIIKYSTTKHLLEKAYKTDSGFDIKADIQGSVVLKPNEVTLIPTGITLDIPEGYDVQVRSRSGLSCKGIKVMNSPGTIDQSYRGEVKVILHNSSNVAFVVSDGMKIAQLVVGLLPTVTLIKVDDINSNSDRGSNGFGSTGL